MASLQEILSLTRNYNKADATDYINWQKSGVTRMLLADDGELQLANATASGQGVLLGGDAEIYRSEAKVLTFPGSVTAIPTTTATSQIYNAAPVPNILTGANGATYTGNVLNVLIPTYAPVANTGAVILQGIIIRQGNINNVADTCPLTVTGLSFAGAAGAALVTGVYTWTWADITMPAQAANGAANVATGLKITGGTASALGSQTALTVTMAASTDAALKATVGYIAANNIYGIGTANLTINGNLAVTDATERSLILNVLNATADAWLPMITLTPNAAAPYITFGGTRINFGNLTDYNAFIGLNSGSVITTGLYNTALGVGSLASTIDGSGNTGVGLNTLTANTSGSYNSAFGAGTLSSNTVGVNNTAFGEGGLKFNATGSGNTALGYEAGFGIGAASNISNNTLIGQHAGYALLTGGDNNILIGYQAGNLLTTGNSNIIIGYDIDPPAATTSSYLNIGGIITGDVTLGLFGFNNLLTYSRTVNSETVNAAATARTLTAANTKSFTGTAEQIVIPGITPAANGAGITMTGLNFTQGAISNVADSEAITVKHIVMTFAAGVALETGIYTAMGLDITLPAQAANGAANVATGLKITGGTASASGAQRGIDITMAAAADTAIKVILGQIILGALKSDTGDWTGIEGLLQINTFDNTIKIYADSGWRTLAAW